MSGLQQLTDVPPEILTVSEMRAVEARVIASGTPGIALMERAGAAVVDVVAARFGGLRSAAVVCGPANNGHDGFVTARGLEQHGVATTVFTLVPVGAIAAQRWHGACRLVSDDVPLDQFGIVVDALFGVGINRVVVGAAAAAISAMNAASASGTPVVAVDIPSGIDGDTGLVRGTAVKATTTAADTTPASWPIPRARSVRP